MKYEMGKYIQYCINEYVNNGRYVGWYRRVCAYAEMMMDDQAYTPEDVAQMCLQRLDLDKWLADARIVKAVERRDIAGLKRLMNKTLYNHARNIVAKINRHCVSVNESQMSTGEDEYNIEDEIAVFDDDGIEDYEETELWKQVILPVLEEEGIRGKTIEKFKIFLHERLNNPNQPKYEIYNKMGVSNMTIDHVITKIKTNPVTANIEKGYGILDEAELERHDAEYWTVDKLEARYGTKAFPFCEGYLEQFPNNKLVDGGCVTYSTTRNLNDMPEEERNAWLKKWNSLKTN